MTSFELLPGRWVGSGFPCFIIAEVGQNHQGDIKTAKRLIEVAKECGADCVKFQKSHLTSRFSKVALARPYVNKNSFGNTYGEHRAHLEFSEEQFIELQRYATLVGIPFTATGADENSMDFLKSINVPFFKIGSADAGNIDLITHTADLGKPMIISTGMQNMSTVKNLYSTLVIAKLQFALLQCTSCYPTDPENVMLGVLESYIKAFPKAVIGYSGHETGIGISIAAVTLGANILERHITLSSNLKGSDHCMSLEPPEFKMLVSEIRKVEEALCGSEKIFLPCETPCSEKLGKTVVATTLIPAHTMIKTESLAVKVTCDPKGWKAENIDLLVGKRVNRDVNKDDSITADSIHLTTDERAKR